MEGPAVTAGPFCLHPLLCSGNAILLSRTFREAILFSVAEFDVKGRIIYGICR